MEFDIGFVKAFLGGFLSFFSIWQVCILQISPFFIAFMIGRYLIDEGDTKIMNAVISGIGYLVGFSITFAVVGTSSIYLSSYILYNIKVFRIISGLIIISIGFIILVFGVLRYLAPLALNRIFLAAGLFLGASFAIAYSPCIPPVLSSILNFASIKENSLEGFLLLATYGSGLTAAFITAGMILSIIAGKSAERFGRTNIVIAGCAFLLIVMGVMVAANLMIYYKSFLLGFFVK